MTGRIRAAAPTARTFVKVAARPMRILSGIQSSGKQHLGNYYGAIRQFVAMQDQG